MSEEQILITRYSSRRLYNTNSSEYVTLEEISTLIKSGKNIKIIDKQTGEDLTKQYLLQIISDIENMVLFNDYHNEDCKIKQRLRNVQGH